ncbi:MAG TPA: EpsI family protein, partial [Burkholderiaceae bacterium]|nr:EpsI family protein [Burkholderiaceae bacterium]
GGATESVHAVVEVEGRPVEAHVFYYARQHEGQEMIHNDHRVVDTGSQQWPVRARGRQDTAWGEVAEYRIGHSSVGQLLLWHWYEVAGRATPSDYVAKGLTALSLLRGNGDHSLAIVLAAPISSDRPEELQRARQALETTGKRLAPATDALSRGEGTPR